MSNFFTWCNDNQGFIMIILTAVYVVATIVMCKINKDTVAVAMEALKLQKQTRADETVRSVQQQKTNAMNTLKDRK